MTILSWNVNGLRALVRNGDWQSLMKMKAQPDIFCLQETKAEPEQLTADVREPAGYHSYFAWSTARKGYSGVALYTKIKPEVVNIGLSEERFDVEGRIITAHFKDFVLLTVYFPNGGQGPERLRYKYDFYDAFLEHILELSKTQKNIIFCGDVNTAHHEIDLARPKENEKNTGFLPEERAWLDEVERAGFTDTYRHFSPNKTGAYTYWDQKTRARDRNVGWRIDYFFASSSIMPKVKAAAILPDIFGSDHCPVSLTLK